MLLPIYYHIKPLIPRRLQIALRRHWARRKLASCKDIWPIDPRAAGKPPGWKGWPEGKRFALVLTHDVETRRGHERVRKLAEMEMELGFRSSFNFVPRRYEVLPDLRGYLRENGFEVGVHGLFHDGKYFQSKEIFKRRAAEINNYLKAWQCVGYRSPLMLHNLDWFHDLDIQYDASTFDTDPFELQPKGMGTIFPFWVEGRQGRPGYVELPYTLPQDFTLFILLEEQGIEIWKNKLDWIAGHGGMVLLNTHPDYMSFEDGKARKEEYPAEYYMEFLKYAKSAHKDAYWNPIPKDLAFFWQKSLIKPKPHKIKHNIVSSRPFKACLVYYAKFKSSALLYREAKALIEKGYDVDVICLRDLETDKVFDTYKGIKVFGIQARNKREKEIVRYFLNIAFFCLKTAFLLSCLAFKNKYRLIHVTSPPDILVFSALIPKMLGAKVILDIHDIGPELYMRKLQVSENSLWVKLLKFFEKISVWFSDHVITVTDLWKDRLLSRSASAEKCTVLLNVPDEEIFKAFKRRDEKNSKINLYYHGSYEEHFGVDTLLKAMPLIKQKVSKVTLHLFGTGRLKEEYDSLIKEMGLENYVFLNDSVPFYDLPNILRDADIGIVPTKGSTFSDEALSMKSLEYISLGIPIVISKTKVHGYYYKESMVKFFQPGNPDDLAKAVIEIAENREERDRLVLNAQRFICENGWNITKEKYYRILDRIFNQNEK